MSHGRFCWFDLMTTDLDAGVGFYTKLFGWEVQTMDMGEMGVYPMWMNGDAGLGGASLLSEQAKAMGAPPHWLGYVEVDAVDTTAEQAAGLGATLLVPPTDIPDIGRFAVLRDPQGGVLAIYASQNPAPDADGIPVGSFTWHEHGTKDLEAGFAFYRELFGWEVVQDMDMGDNGTYRIYGKDGAQYGGFFTLPPGMEQPFWMFYVRVESVEAAIARVEELGGKLTMGPHEVPGGDLIAHFTDPQGAHFAVHEQVGG